MPQAAVIVVDPDLSRRRTLSTLIEASTRIKVNDFAALSAAFPGFRSPGTRVLPDQTRLFICPWDAGGEAIVLERIALGGSEAALLILSDEITPTRIAMCHRAGNTHLLPSNPLNLNALRTRILLSLEGPTTLAARLSRSGAAMRESLSAMPGLRRRLSV